MERIVKLTKPQEEFLTSSARITALIGGIGSGKSWAGAHYAMNRLINNPQTVGFVGANTNQQLRDATLMRFFSVLDEFNIEYIPNWQQGFIEFPSIQYRVKDGLRPAKVKFASLENYNSLRGPEYGWIWLDETRDTRKEAFDVIMGRLRCNKSHKREARITTSPSGYTWLYDILMGKNKMEDVHVITTSTMDNFTQSDDYVDSLKKLYDSRMQEQEIHGRFVNLSAGKIYHAFDRRLHVMEKKLYNLTPRIGVDFNVDNMNAVMGELTQNTFHCFDEVTGGKNSFHMERILWERFKGRGIIVPDSTGQYKKSSSKQSDHQILLTRGFEIEKRVRNPYQEDRWNCVNKLFEEGRLTISPRNEKLIEELERADLSSGDGENEGKNYHITVALGYICWRYFPLRRILSRGTTSRIY